MRKSSILFFVFYLFAFIGNFAIAQNVEPLTVAEKSDYKSTSLSAEVVEFLDWCDQKAEHVNKFVFGKTVEGRDMVGVTISRKPYKLGQKDDRGIALVIGNIHSGECAGKEALLMMIRDLTHNPEHQWLDNMVLVIAPNYGADANDRVGLFNRRGQVGPENGMGRRENAQNLDLNRDFMKLDSPEARNMVGLINQVDPHMFVDCHTTNGSQHQYGLTYDIPHNPGSSKIVRDFLRNKMMPAVTEQMKGKNWLSFYYGNFNRNNDAWTTYGYEPRYSTEYVGMRGRLAILSEAYAYISYKDRIQVSKDFVSSLFDYMHENLDQVKQVCQESDRELIESADQPQRVDVSLAAKVVPFEEKFILKGYKGGNRETGEPHDFECDFIGNYESTKNTPLAFAYLIPQDQARVVDRLRMHGIQLEKLVTGPQAKIQIDKFASIDRAPRAFQQHNMVRAEANRRTETVNLADHAGSYVVRTNQPLGRLATYLLEANSADGLVVWNFFDDSISVGQDYPVVRIQEPTELKTTKVSKVDNVGQIRLDMIDGPNQLFNNDPPAPTWFGKTNLIESESWGRKMLVDAESVSFVQVASTRVNTRSLKEQLETLELDAKAVEAVASTTPNIATNGKTALVEASGYTCLAYLATPEAESRGGSDVESVTLLGTPDDAAQIVTWDESETHLAYVNKAGLNVISFDSGTNVTLNSTGPNDLVGILDWVYQEELYGRGNFKGYWFNPQGDSVAFLRLDESPVPSFSVMDYIPVRGKAEVTNYPKSGDPNPKVQMGIVDLNNPETVKWLDLSEYEGTDILISGVTWNPDGSRVFAQVQNRQQTFLDLWSIGSDGNSQAKLFRDKTPAWIESPGDPVFLNDGRFVWMSPRSGYNHLYLYAADGEMQKPLTRGEWEVRSLIGKNPVGEKTAEGKDTLEYVYLTATKNNAVDMHVYRVSPENARLEQLTSEPGTHSPKFSDDYQFMIDTYSSINSPPISVLRDSSGKVLRRLNATNDDRYEYLNIVQPQFVEVPSSNNQPMDGVIIRPPNFNPNRKYPVLFHVYSGPQAPRVRNRFGGDWYLWHQMLAQQGYVVFMCDNQSASYRSKINVWPIHKNFGETELRDIELGVDWLKKQPWVDGDRIGMWGWSYGGYMTAYAMTHSKSFKMGISGAPVTDWKNYDSIYTERYMDTPQNNPDGYASTSCLPSAKDLHGRMLLIHGTVDDNVHLSNTMQLVYELQKAEKQFDLMVYPKNRHSVRADKQQEHLRKLMTDYVLKNL